MGLVLRWRIFNPMVLMGGVFVLFDELCGDVVYLLSELY